MKMGDGKRANELGHQTKQATGWMCERLCTCVRDLPSMWYGTVWTSGSTERRSNSLAVATRYRQCDETESHRDGERTRNFMFMRRMSELERTKWWVFRMILYLSHSHSSIHRAWVGDAVHAAQCVYDVIGWPRCWWCRHQMSPINVWSIVTKCVLDRPVGRDNTNT